MDCFGGLEYQYAHEDSSDKGDFVYYWEQVNFDPMSARAKFHIHFRQKGRAKVRNVFSYDWRVWTIPELREILSEVGFTKSHVYWEGSLADGSGDGKFLPVSEIDEECNTWIAYLVAEK